MPSLRPMATASVDLPELDGQQIMMRRPKLSSGGMSMCISRDETATRWGGRCGRRSARGLLGDQLLAGIDLVDPVLVAAVEAVERGERGLGVGAHEAELDPVVLVDVGGQGENLGQHVVAVAGRAPAGEVLEVAV